MTAVPQAAPERPQAPFAASAVRLYVRFADVDMMQVVHHAAYIHWFEQIRFHFLTHILGVDRERIARDQISFPLIACEALYRQPFRFWDEPTGYARLRVFKQAKLAVHYAVFKPGARSPAVTGVTTHCFTGAGERLLLNTPPFIAESLAIGRERHPGCFLEQGVESDLWLFD